MAATDPTILTPGSQRSVQLSSSDQTAWIVRDEVDGGWVLQLGGVEQSHVDLADPARLVQDRKSTRLNSSHVAISYAGFCLQQKNRVHDHHRHAIRTISLGG